MQKPFFSSHMEESRGTGNGSQKVDQFCLHYIGFNQLLAENFSFKEGLCAGVPMLFLPFFADQPKNALLAKHWGIAQAIYKKVFKF